MNPFWLLLILPGLAVAILFLLDRLCPPPALERLDHRDDNDR
jgi:hypothetical protein